MQTVFYLGTVVFLLLASGYALVIFTDILVAVLTLRISKRDLDTDSPTLEGTVDMVGCYEVCGS